jgi:co-chaperonin GroES (HSP10)
MTGLLFDGSNSRKEARESSSPDQRKEKPQEAEVVAIGRASVWRTEP